MSARSVEPVVIVGAGVSGLACAQFLRASGRAVTVLDRARGIGGRCATKTFEGQLVDFGPVFLHGRDAEFLKVLDSVPGSVVAGWPAIVEGQGQPCQPDAFTPGERRLAFVEGVGAFPRHLAEGLQVQLEQNVERLEVAGPHVVLTMASGLQQQSPTVVLALAAEQSRGLLASMVSPPPAVTGAAALLALSRSQACLTLMALYPGAHRPSWNVCYPQDSKVLQLVSHETSKRPGSDRVALVFQARSSWSREHLEDENWAAAMLAEAGRAVGTWASTPDTFKSHRWTWARSDRSAELAAPMLLALPGGSRLGLCGDRFAPGGGIEAAWRSGRALAARIISESQETA